jgi:hypothetical protein
MLDKRVLPKIQAAIECGDDATVRDLVTRHREGLRETGYLDSFLRFVADSDNVELLSLLVELGAEINPSHDPLCNGPEGAIRDAAGNGAVNAVRWLLAHGAILNYEVDGVTRCSPLYRAARQGYLEIVKLLVAHGADINAVWEGQNALSFAIMYGKKEVEAYLRSKGALEPWQLRGEKPSPSADPILAHLERHLGKPNPLSLQEIVSGDPPIIISAIPMKDRLALVTTGMSSQPLTVPRGGEEYQYAELLLYLPKDWPLTEDDLEDPNAFWPIDWLRRIARYPHEERAWLGGPFAIIANEEPPQPLAPNTQLSCLLALAETEGFSPLALPDGRRVVFYTLFPLYTEERDLERAKGIKELLLRFQSRRISQVVDVNRPNVALLSARGRGKGRRRSS